MLAPTEEKPGRTSLLALSLIVAFYALKRLPQALSVESYHRLIYPVFSIYAAKSILFPDGALNRSLDGVVISPANAIFIYPPGTYAITSTTSR